MHLGEVKLFVGQLEAAREHLSRALAACREADDRALALLALSRLGDTERLLGGDPLPFQLEAVEEGTAHHIPAYWWASAPVGLAAHRARDAATAGQALAALATLERDFRLLPRDAAIADEAKAVARAAIGGDVAEGWRGGAAALELEQAAVALLSDP